MTEIKKISPLKAIRLKCLDCCGEEFIQVKTCGAYNCPLWKFRLGKHPFTEKNIGNPLLEAKEFIGREHMTHSELIKAVEGGKDND